MSDANRDEKYPNALARVTAERDELQKRVDAVIALPTTANSGWTECVLRVRALLAPKKEPRFSAKQTAFGWKVARSEVPAIDCESIADFHGPDAERHAREFCDRLNRGESE